MLQSETCHRTRNLSKARLEAGQNWFIGDRSHAEPARTFDWEWDCSQGMAALFVVWGGIFQKISGLEFGTASGAHVCVCVRV